MGRIWGNWGVGFAVGALMASFPAFATTYTVSSGSTETVSDLLADGTSTVSVTVTGGGTVVLTDASNTYSGGTIVIDGSTLEVAANGDLGATSGTITLGSSSTAGTLDLSTSTAAVSSSRKIYVLAGGGTIVTGSNAWTLSGVISGAGELTITGGGSLVLTGSNTYTGGTIIEDGTTVYLDEVANLGTGSVTLGSSSTSGTINLTDSTAATTSDRDYIIKAGGGTITTGSYTWTLDGVISGAGHLTIDGTGKLILDGTSTYTGGTTISGGATVEIYADDNLGSTSGGVTLGGTSTTGTLELTSSSAVTSALELTLAEGGGIIDVSDAAWTIAEVISGDGGLTLTGSGTLILEAENTYTGTTTIEDGTLQLGTASDTTASLAGDVVVDSGGTLTGYGTIDGSVTNSGIVSPGSGSSIGTLTVGSYTQSSSGTLALLVTASGNSKLVVTGTATLAGTLKLSLEGKLHAATYDLISAGSISGTFSTVTQTLSAALGDEIVYTSTGVELVITQLTTLPENPTIYTALKSTEIDGAQSTNGAVLSHLSGLRTGAVVDQMAMATTSTHRAGESSNSSPYGTWAQAQGGFGTTDGSGSAPSFSAHGGGFLAGIDRQIGKGGVLGVAIGYDITSVSESGGASGTIDTPRVAAYGGWWFGSIAVDGTLGFGAPSLTSSRPVSQNSSTAKASFVGDEVTAAMQASSSFSLGSFAVTPAAGVQYARLGLHSFSEDGASGYDLDGPQSTTSSLRPFVAATVSTRYFTDTRTVLEPTLRVAYSSEVLSTSRKVAIQPSGDDALFIIDGAKASRGQASVDAGLVVETSHSVGFYTNADLVGLGNTTGVKLDAGFRYRF